MPATTSTIPQAPALLAKALGYLPIAPLQPLFALCLSRIVERHPDLFERLGPYAAKRFGLDPTDLPFAFVLEPRRLGPKVTAVRALPARLDARIHGPISALLGLADGTQDGDALFFSRDIQIEGDVEAVLALRNALDDAQIRLVQECLGPLSAPVEQVMRLIGGLGRRGTQTERKEWN